MAPPKAKQPTDRITVRLPKAQIQQIDALVNAGVVRNLSQFIFDAVRNELLAKGTTAKQTIEAEKGLLEMQQAIAMMEAAKRKLGLS